MKTVFYLTCEHASRYVPSEYRNLFTGHKELLLSHRGWDPGAERVAESVQNLLQLECLYGNCSRLFVELNRSLRNKNLFSFVMDPVSKGERQDILEEFYFPYRRVVEEDISLLLKKGIRVIHLSIHTFTPELNGDVRETDLAFLYNPRSYGVREVCETAAAHMNQAYPKLRTRLNYPYRGTVDCIISNLEKKYRSPLYLGTSLEINQKYFEKGARNQGEMADLFAELFINGLHEGRRILDNLENSYGIAL